LDRSDDSAVSDRERRDVVWREIDRDFPNYCTFDGCLKKFCSRKATPQECKLAKDKHWAEAHPPIQRHKPPWEARGDSDFESDVSYSDRVYY
jgi:hypothetical protein